MQRYMQDWPLVRTLLLGQGVLLPMISLQGDCGRYAMQSSTHIIEKDRIKSDKILFWERVRKAMKWQK